MRSPFPLNNQVMRNFILLCLCLGYMLSAVAQEKPIKLFPEGVPGGADTLAEKKNTEGNRVAGETVMRITNVNQPTITIYQPSQEFAAGSAVIVCPGGGYDLLAYDLEGDEACLWLNDLGITAVLLKYRVPQRQGRPPYEAPLQDLQRAISYVRANHTALNIDPNRIGVLGFSSGGHLAALAATSFDRRTYPTKAVDKASCRPNFCLLVYPAYLGCANDSCMTMAPELRVTKRTPPTMIVQTEDDKSFVDGSLSYYLALKDVGVRAWLFFYSRGGHGYGLRDTGVMVNSWPDRAEDWFREIGVIRADAGE